MGKQRPKRSPQGICIIETVVGLFLFVFAVLVMNLCFEVLSAMEENSKACRHAARAAAAVRPTVTADDALLRPDNATYRAAATAVNGHRKTQNRFKIELASVALEHVRLPKAQDAESSIGGFVRVRTAVRVNLYLPAMFSDGLTLFSQEAFPITAATEIGS